MRRLAFVVFLGLTFTGLAAESQWRPALDETRDGKLRFQALGATNQLPVRISQCADERCDQSTAVASATSPEHVMPMPEGPARAFYVVQRGGERRVVAARRLALQGAYNFRDLGGLAAQDGRTVRWGRLFRSDVLSRLTEADYRRLNALGIDLVCDLRGRDERQSDPTIWPNASPTFLLAPLSEDARGQSTTSVVTELSSGRLSVAQGKDLFEEFYSRMAIDAATKIGHVIRALASSDRPALFHCTGGRDRTGLIAALTLEMLGVPRDTILQDYVASNGFLAERGPVTSAMGLDGERARMVAEVLELQPRYVQAVFRRIDAERGSFAVYRRDALGVSDIDLERLRARLLQ